MAGGGAGGQDITQDELKQANELKKMKNFEHMSKYHQDLLKWARNVDQRYAWVVLFALWVMMAATLGPYRIYGLVFAKVTSEGIYTREEAFWPVATILTVENIVGPFVSIIAYKISGRLSMLIGGVLMCLGTGLTYFSNSLAADIVLIGFVTGIGMAFTFMPYMEFINSYFIKYRNMALGLSLCGGTMSVFVLAPIFQWLLDTQPWRATYLVAGGICFTNVIMSLLLKTNKRPEKPVSALAKCGLQRNTSNLSRTSMALTRMSARALSFRNSIRHQSTVMIATISSSSGTTLKRNSIITVNPFASPATIRERTTAVMSEQLPDEQQQSAFEQQQQQQQHNGCTQLADTKYKSSAPIISTAADNFKQPQQDGTVPKRALSPSRSLSSQVIVQHAITAASGDGVPASVDTTSIADNTCQLANGDNFNLGMLVDILKKPGFHLIWYLELLYFWAFSIVSMVMVDLGTDHGCTREESEYLLSFQSVGEILGRCVLTVLVDMRFMSHKNTVLLNLVVAAFLLLTLPFAQTYVSIAIVTVLLNAFLSLLYILLNGLLVEFLGERMVTIGYGMASFIVGIGIIFRPAAIGFFRDYLGSYDLLMVTLGVLTLFAAVLTALEPLVTRCVQKSLSASAKEKQVEYSTNK